MNKEKKKNFIIELWNYAKPSKLLFGAGLIFSLIGTIASLFVPLLIKDVISDFSNGFDILKITYLIMLIIMELICTFFSLYILAKVGESVIKHIRQKLWDKSLKLPMNYYDKNSSGDLVSRIVNDTTLVSEVLSTKLVDLITNILTVILGIFFLFMLDVPLATVFIIVVPLTILIVVPLGEKIFDLAYKEQDTYSKLTSFLSQTLSEVKLVKSFNMQKKESEKGLHTFEKLMYYGLKQAKIKAFVTPLLAMITMIVIIGVVSFGIWRVDQGFISSGEFVAFILYLFQIVAPFIQMNEFVTDFQEAQGATQRIFNILEESEEVDSPSNNNVEKERNLDLIFRNINFAYDGLHTTLNNLSFTIPDKSYFAIVGPSGSGKSTIFSLIERFYNPTQGELLIGNTNSQDINIYEWRDLFSYVPQDSPIFAGTIKDNIVYGLKKDISDKEIIAAAKKANIHEFIMSMPEQYDTQVIERGNNISGGQKQRIAIARAFLKDAPFLLLDEATSSLDSESEEIIKKALNELSKNRTTIVIAHRLSTVVDADRIMVLKDGCITGMGTHEELLKSNEFYNKMVNVQFKKDIKEK